MSREQQSFHCLTHTHRGEDPQSGLKSEELLVYPDVLVQL